MMNGIEVVSRQEIVNHVFILPGWAVFLVCALAVILPVLIEAFIEERFYFSNRVFTLSAFACLILMIGCLFGTLNLLSKSEETGRYKYDVRISDDVTFNEFNRKYKILEKTGDIYTIEKIGNMEE